ncbi:MAG: helix-turn-helix transcriptional regulator, partial [bacterium]|nr:helix-turn-helix transcriptional regulator [bacterium]
IMNHFSIFIEITALVIGSIAIFYCYQFYRKFQHDFIKFYIFYLILGNLINISNLVVRYLSSNLFQAGYIDDAVLKILINIIITYILFGAVYYRISITVFIREKLFPPILKKIFIVLIAFISIIIIKEIFFPSYTGQVVNLYFNGSEYGTRRILYFVIHIECISTLIIFLELIINAGFKNFPKKRKAIILFGSFHLLIFPLLLYIYIPRYVNLSILLAIHAVLRNTIPLVWFKFLFTEYYLGGVLSSSNKKTLSEVIHKYKITQRESEIIDLILQGKSNKEINDILHLSLNTVRNHIYNVYQKLGVNSRTQMINLILDHNHRDNIVIQSSSVENRN